MPPVRGVTLATAEAGIRYRGREDAMLMALADGTSVAGAFTRSRTAAPPVDWCRAVVGHARARALLVNSGNANAFTGRLGKDAVQRSAGAVAARLGCPPDEVLLASTGVIGEPLPVERLEAVVPALQARLRDDGWEAAAQAIMTTDTFAKGASRQAPIDGAEIVINGIAKGAGMIAPDMATMLAFVATDAAVAPDVLHTLLTDGVERSFNCITIDGDTSTNDTVLLFATGTAGNAPIADADDARTAALREALDAVLIDLAQQIVRDGEGATKFVTVLVDGAASDRAARRIALTIANSPLVKTAIAGQDANWGRIVMAVGRAGEEIDADTMTIHIGGILVAERGARAQHFSEGPVAAHMRGEEIAISVRVGAGSGTATVWTCDLTHGYIDINGAYRT
jgi:glutamate N-acetyltransferase/amino-acid N-acetyltransferase